MLALLQAFKYENFHVIVKMYIHKPIRPFQVVVMILTFSTPLLAVRDRFQMQTSIKPDKMPEHSITRY